jgi:hypothetical protein
MRMLWAFTHARFVGVPRLSFKNRTMTWDSQANFDRLHESAKMGGSFNRDIIAAFFSADWTNKPRLVEAFPEIFKP